MLLFALRTVQILTRTQPSLRPRLGSGEFVPGMSVMGNAYPATNGKQRSSASSVREDAAWDDDDIERVSLVEENARLRELVVKLSDIVLRNVVERK